MKDKFDETINYIVSVLKDAGYEPYDQLFAYINTGNDSFITRKGNAREMIKGINSDQLRDYIMSCKDSTVK